MMLPIKCKKKNRVKTKRDADGRRDLNYTNNLGIHTVIYIYYALTSVSLVLIKQNCKRITIWICNACSIIVLFHYFF